MSLLSQDVIQRIHALIYDSCLLLNAERWPEFLALCDPAEFQYTITTYSPEIQKEQCWMDHDCDGIRRMFELLPRHNSDRAQLTRHGTVCKVEYDADRNEASAVTMVTIYRTELDGKDSFRNSGLTSLFAVGSYLDRVRLDGEEPRLISRNVRLDTRQLNAGSHLPF